MVQSAHGYHEARERLAPLGIRVDNVTLDFPQVQLNRQGIVDGVVKGLGGLMKGVGIQVVTGRDASRARTPCRSRALRRCASRVP